MIKKVIPIFIAISLAFSSVLLINAENYPNSTQNTDNLTLIKEGFWKDEPGRAKVVLTVDNLERLEVTHEALDVLFLIEIGRAHV